MWLERKAIIQKQLSQINSNQVSFLIGDPQQLGLETSQVHITLMAKEQFVLPLLFET
jgi:hypothetical protein